jgi:hypothetical protein
MLDLLCALPGCVLPRALLCAAIAARCNVTMPRRHAYVRTVASLDVDDKNRAHAARSVTKAEHILLKPARVEPSGRACSRVRSSSGPQVHQQLPQLQLAQERAINVRITQNHAELEKLKEARRRGLHRMHEQERHDGLQACADPDPCTYVCTACRHCDATFQPSNGPN